MSEWHERVQKMIDAIDEGIRTGEDEGLTLMELARKAGVSDAHFSRKFREITGMSFRDYLRKRRLAFALKSLRDTDEGILDIALRYGFSSHEAFSRAFRELYGMTPKSYREHPKPVVLRTVIKPLDCFLAETEVNMGQEDPGEVKSYFVTIPAHRFLHIRNYESIGYWDFWEKQSRIPGQDCETVCGLLESLPGKLDDIGGTENNSGAGQVMAYINEPQGRLCSWGIPQAEAYGVRLAADWEGEIPPHMQMMEVPEGEYIVFEHGPFDFRTQNAAVEAKIEAAMAAFDYEASGYALDLTQGRVFYFFHDEKRFWKYIRPVKKK